MGPEFSQDDLTDAITNILDAGFRVTSIVLQNGKGIRVWVRRPFEFGNKIELDPDEWVRLHKA